MISAHDSTVSMWEMFLIKVFLNNDKNEYIFPKFATQMTFEVYSNTTNTSNEKDLQDYTIKIYRIFDNKS